MLSSDTIREQFDELGIEPSDEIINKCIEICVNNDIRDPVEFVEQWMAFSVSKLSGAEPTVAYLNEMEAHEYTSKTARKVTKASNITGAGLGNVASVRMDTKVSKITTYRNVDSVEQDVLEMYGCITPKTKKSASRLQSNKNTPECIRGGSSFTTVTYSPLSTSSKKIDTGSSSKAGQVVYTYGNAQLLKQINWLSAAESENQAEDHKKPDGNPRRTGVKVSLQPTLHAHDRSKYMFDSSYDRVIILGDWIYETGNAICHRLAEEQREMKLKSDSGEPKTNVVVIESSSSSLVGGDTGGNKPAVPVATELASAVGDLQEGIPVEGQMVEHGDENANEWFDGVMVHHADYPSSSPIRVLGRIVVEPSVSKTAAPGKGSSNDRLSIVDFDEHTLRYTRLDLSKVAVPGWWSLFPGQIVLLEGINPRGAQLSVSRIYHERILTLPCTPNGLERPLTMVIASAPFTDRDDLLYEKLSDLLQYCSANPPDVLLLTGPFADASCPLYTDVAETFEEYFEKIIGTIMGSVGGQTEVCVVANHDDVVSPFVYPTRPYKVSGFYKNLHFLPDPCLFSVEGVEIGVTTVDIIKQLVDAESKAEGAGGGDKIKRAYNHLFHQASFYPLNPPSEDVPVDVELLNEFGRLNRVPNVMVCPSALNRYVREINRCVCINPGFVDGHSVDGSYARLIVHPPAETASDSLPSSYIACQIIKT